MMARTERRSYRDEWGRESRHWWGKRCPEPNCPACHTGREKRTWNRWWRRQWKGKEEQ